MMRHRARWLLAVACALGLDGGPRVGLACTTIGVGKDASADGSTMTTHNADVRREPLYYGCSCTRIAPPQPIIRVGVAYHIVQQPVVVYCPCQYISSSRSVLAAADCVIELFAFNL